VSDRRKYLLLLLVILAAVGGVAYMAIPGSPGHKKATLGLDLQGGLEVVLQAEPHKGQKLDPEALTRSVDIMRTRIDKLGVSEPEIRKQGSNQIVIQLAGVHDPAAAARLIGKTASLEFYDLEADLTGPSRSVQGGAIPKPNLYSLLTPEQAQIAKDGAAQWYLFDTKTKKVVVGPIASKDSLYKTRKAKTLGIVPPNNGGSTGGNGATGGNGNGGGSSKAKGSTSKSNASGKNPSGKNSTDKYTAFGVPKGTVVITCGKGAVVCPGVGVENPTTTSYYLFKYDPQNAQGTVENPVPELTGDQLKLSGTRADFDPTQGPIVLMQFTSKGSHAFQRITKDLYIRGRTVNSPQHFAIVLDREIRSFPQIDYTDSSLSNGISGNAEINGLQSFTEAKNLALVLQTGALPVNFKQIERTDVSATLGKDSLQQAKRAAIGGLIAVVVFLILLYRFLGLIAVLGLGIYAALLYGAILVFGVTLTLPGFAGLILTIGVAADANVVVFERIKEEVRSGKSVRAAIAAGYAKGFRTIVDANVVTSITALVLFAVAVAQVKGFALMLLIGTVISLVTAVAATRAMLGLLAGFRWFDNPAFMGAHGTQGLKFLHIDYMRRRYLWFAISGTIIAIGAVSLGVKGLNLGIDFKGGTQMSFSTPRAASLSTVRDEFKTIGHADAIVQGRGKQTGSDSYKEFQVRLKELKASDQTKVQNDLESKVQAKGFGVKNVSSSFGRQIAKDALLAIFFSLFLVVIYIAIRFDVKFAVPVILAMIHDVVITVGIYSVTGREVTTSTVAAVLTVLGYSIYDTIIIFDRIRENIPLMRRAPFATIANISLWETIRRSLATTFITLLPVGALFWFGGATLKDFAFALLVGVASGAYSSIFIAAPILTMWKEREPEFARRVEHKTDDHAEGVLAQAEAAAAAEPTPELAPVAAVERVISGDGSKRERRRQRRRSRPHGRAR
jgi:SecD/SecF fusion protein